MERFFSNYGRIFKQDLGSLKVTSLYKTSQRFLYVFAASYGHIHYIHLFFGFAHSTLLTSHLLVQLLCKLHFVHTPQLLYALCICRVLVYVDISYVMSLFRTYLISRFVYSAPSMIELLNGFSMFTYKTLFNNGVIMCMCACALCGCMCMYYAMICCYVSL